MEAILITVFALLFVILLKLSGKTRQERFLDALPGPKGYPFIGNFFDIFRTRQNFLCLSIENESKFGSIYKTWIGSTPVVHISKPNYVEAILSTKGATRQPDKNSLIIKSLKVHPYNSLKNKNVAASVFNSMTYQSVIDITNDNCKILLGALREKSVLDREYLKLCVIDSICEIILGVRINTQCRQNESFATSLIKLNKLSEKNERVRFYSDSLFRVTTFGKEYFHHLNVVQEFINEIVQKKINAKPDRDNKTETSTSCLNDFLIFNGLYSIEDLQRDIFTLIASTLNSIEASIYFSLCALGHQSTVQEKLLREIQTNSAGKGNDFLTIKDLKKMIYLDRVIKETLRLFPPCPFIVKELERDVKIASYLIPHGTVVCIQIVHLHRDPDSFDNRNKFDPDNFSPRKIEKRNRFSYIPFSVAEGSCIGQKLTEIMQRLVLIKLIREFKIETTENSNNSDPSSINNYIKLCKSEINLRLLPRDKAD